MRARRARRDGRPRGEDRSARPTAGREHPLRGAGRVRRARALDGRLRRGDDALRQQRLHAQHLADQAAGVLRRGKTGGDNAHPRRRRALRRPGHAGTDPRGVRARLRGGTPRSPARRSGKRSRTAAELGRDRRHDGAGDPRRDGAGDRRRARGRVTRPRAFTNGRIYALDPATGAYRRHRELVVQGAQIAALGEDLCGAGVERIDLAGKTLLPAFADSHIHLTDTGWFLGERSLDGLASYAQFERRVRALAGGATIFAGQYDDAHWSDGREADAQPLEAAFPHRLAMLVRIDAHSCIVNRKTLAWLDLPPGLEGIERDAAGVPTGRLFLEANWRAQTAFMAALPEHERRAAERRALEEALRRGALHLHVQLVGFESRESFAAEMEAMGAVARAIAPELAGKIHWKLCTMDVAIAADLGLPYVGGDVFLDGSIGSRTAAVGEPYLESGGYGKLFHSDAEVAAYLRAAEGRGISAGVHAIGDRALAQAIAAIEAALGGRPSQRTRHFIEHAEMLSPEQIARCALLGIHLSMQPQFDALWGGDGSMYERRLGRTRKRAMNRLASIVRSGIVAAGGDDSPVCRLAPLEGMEACLTHHEPAERLDAEQALTLYTYNAARLGHAELRTGRLAPGQAADLVILDRDPLAERSFAAAQVLETWGDGRCLYDRA
ncbi:hypothetical protein EPN44_07390 [bacterium]|nr:MAG: hypothetical protein EPN44_07390 [bacterium]